MKKIMILAAAMSVACPVMASSGGWKNRVLNVFAIAALAVSGVGGNTISPPGDGPHACDNHLEMGPIARGGQGGYADLWVNPDAPVYLSEYTGDDHFQVKQLDNDEFAVGHDFEIASVLWDVALRDPSLSKFKEILGSITTLPDHESVLRANLLEIKGDNLKRFAQYYLSRTYELLKNKYPTWGDRASDLHRRVAPNEVGLIMSCTEHTVDKTNHFLRSMIVKLARYLNEEFGELYFFPDNNWFTSHTEI